MKFILYLLFALTTLGNVFGANDLSTTSFTNTYLDKSCFLFSAEGEQVYSNTNPQSNLASKYTRPMTSRIVECIDGTLSNLFIKAKPESGFTLFQEFQSVVKPVVILALILYLVWNGYLIAIGQKFAERPTQEIIIFLLKFILVFYFAVGDAWKDFFFFAIRSVGSTFGSILIEAGANTTSDGCNFTSIGYPNGKGYIAIFDTLDCKFGNYLGWFVDKKFPILVPIGITLFFLPGVGPFAFSVVFVLLIQLIILAARVTQLYLVSIMILTFLIYASPLIVPMALFDYTKGMFEQWLKNILGLTVHPVMVFALVGILLSVTDRIYYGANPDANNLFSPHQAFSYQKTQNTNAGILNLNIGSLIKMTEIEKPDTPLNTKELLQKLYNNQERDATVFKAELDAIRRQIPCNQACKTRLSEMSSIYEKGQENATYFKKLIENFDNIKLDEIKKFDVRFLTINSNTALGGVNAILQFLWYKPSFHTANILYNPNAISGSAVDKNCYGGMQLATSSFFTPLVCVMKWLDNTALTIGFPIPYFIEIFEFYVPFRPDIAVLFFIITLICCGANVLIGVILERVETLIEQISGTEVNKFGSYKKIMGATIASAIGAKNKFGEMQDRVYKREKSADGGGKNSTNASGGGEAKNSTNAKGSDDKNSTNLTSDTKNRTNVSDKSGEKNTTNLTDKN